MRYPFPIYDAHNHLHDSRLASQFDSIVKGVEAIPVHKMVVNGTCEADWDSILRLAGKYNWVLPSIGLHPWYVGGRTDQWQEKFSSILEANRCAIGEIGLDRWVEKHDINAQEEVFRWQLQQAVKFDRPIAIHCLQAWGLLNEVLKSEKLPTKGFLIHSYSGPVEMVEQFAELGGYFSLSGYFAHERKTRQREVFRTVPLDRLLLETDAPDMAPPGSLQLHYLCDTEGTELNHPANIAAVYEFAAELYNIGMEELALNVESNFQRLFGTLYDPKVGRDR